MKIIKQFAVVVFVLLSGTLFSPAQVKEGGSAYQTPERLVLNGVGEPVAGAESDYNGLINESFYPIGFSRDGNFAYYIEPGDEACGCYISGLVIQDLKTDKILWEYKYWGDQEDAPKNETIDSHWEKNKKQFTDKLSQFGIEQQRNFKQYNPSMRLGNDIFSPKLSVKIETDGGFEVDGTVTLKLNSKLKGTKTIFKKTYDPKDVNGFRDAELSGFLKSPFEPRIAVIMVETQRGYEGPPNTTHVKIVGSDLTSRFR